MSRKSVVVAVAMMIAAFTSPLDAQSRGKEKSERPTKSSPPAGVVAPGAKQSSVVIFHDTDRAAFRRYHRDHPVAITDLPPGIRKRIARGKPLPPGIAKKQLSPGLTAIAPRLARGHSYARVGRDVVVLDPAGLVVDLLVDAFR